MAKIPTPEESAGKILKIFMNYKQRPGEVLSDANLENTWSADCGPMEDYNRGVDYAIKKGWIERADNGYRLTQIGFEEAP